MSSSSNRYHNNNKNGEEEDSCNTLQQKVKQLENEIKKAEKERILLKSSNEKLKKKLNLERCLGYQPKMPPPYEIDRNKPITMIVNEIFNAHVCRTRKDLENWSSKSFNYTENWEHSQVMEAWSIYKWNCKLANIPQAQQMQLQFTKFKPDKYRMELVLGSNCLTRSHGYCSQPAEAVSYQSKLGKIYIYTQTNFLFVFMIF